MISATEKRSLGNAGMSAYPHWLKVENENLLAQPTPVPQLKLPREMNIDTRFDVHTNPNLRSESPKYRTFPLRRPWKRAKEKETFCNVPDNFIRLAAASVQPQVSVKFIESRYKHWVTGFLPK
jgi:hypothetical protein